MNNRMVRAVCILLALTVSGCLPTRTESPPTHTFRLSLDSERTETRPPDVNGPILLVSLPVAEPGYETTKMVYLKRPFELEPYAVNQWADTPARMFASLMVEKLSRTGSWRAVVPPSGSIRGDVRLDTYGFSLQQEFLKDPSLMRISVRAQLVDVREARIVGTRAFETVENAPSADAYGGVVAANQAVAVLLDDMAAWLKECMKRSPECSR
ncbi:MAG TPA: ABC-type transport auxiliary lipoprotein family protein [Nitrospira sp.]|nr:ABC-type transport auxiliary lipoprotein family protein [Nitrospira sp.]